MAKPKNGGYICTLHNALSLSHSQFFTAAYRVERVKIC